MGGLDKIRGDENLILGISELINAMAELSRFAEEHHLEPKLYQELGGLGKVRELMGKSRLRKFVKQNTKLSLSYQEEWNKIITFLEWELEYTQNFVVVEKSMQPICPTIANSEKTGKFGANNEFES